MTQQDPLPTLKQLAKQGDRAAIAQWLSHAVAHKQWVATVAFHADGVEVSLEAAAVPDETIATVLIQRALLSLRRPDLTTIRISGKASRDDALAWVREVDLNTVPFPAQRSQAARLRSRSKPPFTLTIQDVWHFAAGFDPFKAGLIGLLAFYGLVGAPNYTVDGFLDGSDRIMMFLHGVNLIFHEAGHTIFALFGNFLHILGGSLMQVLVPAGIAGYFVVTRQMYASTIALCWAAQNLWDVSIYIKDAQERSLPLLGGEGVLHDWHFLLLDLHLLTQDQLVGSIAFFWGSLLYLIAIVGGIYYARTDVGSPDSERMRDEG